MVLHFVSNFTHKFVFSCPFRPLTGIMVLHSTLYKWLNYAVENSVCGADFIFRLFSDFSLKISFKNPQRPPFHHIGAEWYKTYEICLYYTILLKFFVEYRKYFLTPPVKGLAMMRSYAGLNTIRDLHHLFPHKKRHSDRPGSKSQSHVAMFHFLLSKNTFMEIRCFLQPSPRKRPEVRRILHRGNRTRSRHGYRVG